MKMKLLALAPLIAGTNALWPFGSGQGPQAPLTDATYKNELAGNGKVTLLGVT